MKHFERVMANILARVPEDDPGVIPAWKLEERRERERQRADEIKRSVAALGLPGKALAIVSGAPFHDTEAVQALQVPATITLLSGAPGCGKTVAAAAWLWSWAQDGHSGLWVTAARLARWERYDAAEMDKLLKVPRLVVDDLGTEFLDERGSFMALFDELLNERYSNGRPLVVTTNLNAEAFKARYHERIVDRIREDGRFVAIATGTLRARAARS